MFQAVRDGLTREVRGLEKLIRRLVGGAAERRLAPRWLGACDLIRTSLLLRMRRLPSANRRLREDLPCVGTYTQHPGVN